MELVKGEDLAQRITRVPIPDRRSTRDGARWVLGSAATFGSITR